MVLWTRLCFTVLQVTCGQFWSTFFGDSLWCAALQTASGAPCAEKPVGSLTFHLFSSWGTLKMSLIVYSQGIQPWQSCRVVKMQQDVTVVSSLVIVNNSATLPLLFSAICLQSRVYYWMNKLMNYFGGAITLPPNPGSSACRKGIPFWIPYQLSPMNRVRALVPKTWIHQRSQRGSRITWCSKSKDGWRGGQETCCYFLCDVKLFLTSFRQVRTWCRSGNKVNLNCPK